MAIDGQVYEEMGRLVRLSNSEEKPGGIGYGLSAAERQFSKKRNKEKG